MSARLTALATTSISTSPGPGEASGTSPQPRASAPPGCLTVTARIRTPWKYPSRIDGGLSLGFVIQHNSRVPGSRVAPPPRAGGTDTALYARVERQVPKLARGMVEAFVKEIPLYSLLPREQLEGEIL